MRGIDFRCSDSDIPGFDIHIEFDDFVMQQFRVSQVAKYFENLTACREHATAVAFIFVEGVHELDFLLGIISFTGGRVNLSPSLNFLSVSLFLLGLLRLLHNRLFGLCRFVFTTIYGHQFFP